MIRLAILALLAPSWSPGFIGAALFLSGLTLGLLFVTGGCRV